MKGVCTVGKRRFTCLEPGLVRMAFNPAGRFENRPSIVAVLLTALAFATCAQVTAAGVFWEPYAYDGLTAILCHFDGREAVSMEDLLRPGDGGDAAMALLGDGVGAGASDRRVTGNDLPMAGATIPLFGASEEVADEGRFGGGLRLTGADGRLAVSGTPGADGWTLEAWFKAASLPDVRATLIDLPHGTPMRIALLADGRLAAQWLQAQEEALTEWRAEEGLWFHLALVWRATKQMPSEDWEGELVVHVDGRPVLSSGSQPPGRFQTTLSGTVAVGNDAKGRSGFDGWLDELRLSKTARRYYLADLEWADVEGARPERPGRPYFRDSQDLIVRLAFNEDLTPEVNPARLEPPQYDHAQVRRNLELGLRSGPRRFADGVERQAVVLGPDQLALRYVAPSNPVHFEQGSVAFWVRPINWDNRTRWASTPMSGPQKVSPVFQFNALHHDGSPLKFGPFMHLFMIRTPDETLANPADLHPGVWTHLCVTWGAGGRRTYVNGQRRDDSGAVGFSIHPERVKAGVPVHLVFGRTDTAFDFEPVGMGDSACAVDDFRIYRRVLAPSEIRNLATLFDRRAELTPLPAVDMTTRYNGVLGWVDVELFPLDPDAAKAVTARVTVTATNAPALIGARTFELKGDEFVGGRIETPVMAFTNYVIKAVVLDAAGVELFQSGCTFTRKAPPWWQNRVGISDKVMPGWEAVRISDQLSVISDRSSESTGIDGHRQASTGVDGTDGTVVSISLRDIQFAASGLPAKVVSAGEDILAGPMELVATVDGKETPLKPMAGAFRAESRGEVRADFSGRAEGGGVTADVKGYVEFDGFMWFDVEVQGQGSTKLATKDGDTSTIHHSPFTIHHLSLRIPYTAANASLMHFWSGHEQFRDPRCVWSGETPADEGVVFQSNDKQRVTLYPNIRGSFMPYVMLAGERRGLAWFAENDQGWTQSTNTPAIAIERQGEVVTLVLNIISEPVNLASPRRFAFGLHPIPVKELQRGWRMTPSWGVAPDVFCGFRLTGDASTVMYRHPADMDWDAVPARWAERKMGGPAESFAAYGRPPLDHELVMCGKYFDFQWIDAFPEDSREWAEEFWARGYTPDVVDYTAWIWNEWVRRGFAEGMYMDDIWNRAKEQTPGVSYTLPDGTNQPGFPWHGPRESIKRMRQVMVDHGLPPHFCVHSTHTLYPPYQSFFDVVLDGEDFLWRSTPDPRTFMSFWPAARLRFMNPKKWGQTITWLGSSAGLEVGPQFKTYHFKQERAWTGALLVHDLVWTLQPFTSPALLDYDWVRSARLRFDPDTEFVGYWDPATPAIHTHRDLHVSVWKRDGWCAVALANWGTATNPLQAEIRLDLKAMGFGDLASNAVTVRDVDATLLTYFDDDVTTLAKPELRPSDAPDGRAKELDAFVAALEKPKSLAERKVADPVGAFEWQDGILRCPVRPHDFRLFEFRPQGEAVGP